MDGFGDAAKGGLEVGANRTGVQAPAGVPAQVTQQLQRLAEEVFKNGFVDAMHPTLILPIAIVVLAAVSCLAVKRREHKAQPEGMKQQAEEVVA